VPPSAALTAFGSSHLLAPVLPALEDAEAAVDMLFIAPEQLRGEPAGPAADQYALACVLFTALTGTTPFRGETNSELFGSHLFTEAPRASAVRDDLDPSWDEVFARGLAKEPDERFENCRTLVLAAGRCAHGARRAPVTSPRTEQRPTGEAPVDAGAPSDDERPWWRRRLLRIVLIVALLAALVVLATMFGVGGPADAAGLLVLTGSRRPAAADQRPRPRLAAAPRSVRPQRDPRRRSP
jgi:serine/threonine protein kinase